VGLTDECKLTADKQSVHCGLKKRIYIHCGLISVQCVMGLRDMCKLMADKQSVCYGL